MGSDLNRGWQKALLDRVDKRVRESTRVERVKRSESSWGFNFHVRTSRDMMALIRACARARNISVAGYIRRSIAKQVASDLGVDPKEVYGLCPSPAEFGKSFAPTSRAIYAETGKRRVVTVLPDDGEGFGEW